jgi:hypothetical protein
MSEINDAASNMPEVSEDGPTEVQQRTLNIPFPETFLYSNCAAFSVGQHDIRVGFAEAMPDGTAVAKVGIVMPPETAAVVAMGLFQQVKTFEANFGEIRHPMWKAMKAGNTVKSPYVTETLRNTKSEI